MGVRSSRVIDRLLARRRFDVTVAGRGAELIYYAATPAELMDQLLRSRYRRRLTEICQKISRHEYRLLASIEPIGDCDAIDAACGLAFSRYRRR